VSDTGPVELFQELAERAEEDAADLGGKPQAHCEGKAAAYRRAAAYLEAIEDE
jgi:hypothetical protein